MLALETRANAASLAVRYDKAPTLLSTTLVKVMRRIGGGLQTHVVREMLSGQVLTRRTSTLSRAIFYTLRLEGQDAVLILGADAHKAIYAAIQEFGGTIVPKAAQNLAIPLDAARTARGVARLSAREFINNPQSLGFDRAFVNKKRTAIMGATDDGDVEPVFALKKSVTLPERSYLRRAIQERRDWILEELGLGTKQAIEDALTGQTTIVAGT